MSARIALVRRDVEFGPIFFSDQYCMVDEPRSYKRYFRRLLNILTEEMPPKNPRRRFVYRVLLLILYIIFGLLALEWGGEMHRRAMENILHPPRPLPTAKQGQRLPDEQDGAR